MSGESTAGGFVVGWMFGIMVGSVAMLGALSCTEEERPMVPDGADCLPGKVIAYTPDEWPEWQCRGVSP